MPAPFSRVILYARPYRANQGVSDTLEKLLTHLSQSHAVYLEQETAGHFALDAHLLRFDEFRADGDLLVVIGGDGSLLSAAREAAAAGVTVTGINRGQLGFLTDILPDDATQVIPAMINGEYQAESRFLLTVSVDNQTLSPALNDVVLMPGREPHMVDFVISINDQPAYSQRADGLIIATPTGSTAYALSAGGPILHPQLSAITLVPLNPHRLSSRPLVINADSEITIEILADNPVSPRLICDAQVQTDLKPGTQFTVRQQQEKLNLIHPISHNYYETLRSKLGWEGRLC